MALDEWQMKMMLKAFRPLLPLLKAELAGVDPALIPITIILDEKTLTLAEAMDMAKSFDLQSVERVRIEVKTKSGA